MHRDFCVPWLFVILSPRRAIGGLLSGMGAPQIQPRQSGPGLYPEGQRVGDDDVRVLLLSSKIYRRPNPGAAVSGGKVGPGSVEGSVARGAALRAGLDAVHAHRHAGLGLLSTITRGVTCAH